MKTPPKPNKHAIIYPRPKYNEPTTQPSAELEKKIRDCFKRTKMQQEGDTELFDTDLTVELLTKYIDQAVLDGRIDELNRLREQTRVQTSLDVFISDYGVAEGIRSHTNALIEYRLNELEGVGNLPPKTNLGLSNKEKGQSDE